MSSRSHTLLGILCSAGLSVCVAAEGDLDPAFGSSGVIINNLLNSNARDQGYSSRYQSDGKLVTISSVQVGNQLNWAVSRFTTTGLFDPSFSGDGKLMIDFDGFDDYPQDLTIDSQGRILVTGKFRTSSGDFNGAVVRLLSDGQLDTTFGTAGIVRLDLGATNDNLRAIAVDSQDRPVVGGHTTVGNDQRVALYRLSANGALDKSFSGDGKLLVNLVSGDYKPETIHGLIVDASDRIIFGGEHLNSSGLAGKGYVGRVLADGTLDSSFNGGGTISFDSTTAQVKTEDGDVQLLPDGSVLWTGYTWFNAESGGANSLSVVKVTAAGSLDASFGNAGRASLFIPGYTSRDNSSVNTAGIVPLDNGSMLVGGSAVTTTSSSVIRKCFIARLSANGSLDTSFANNGYRITDADYQQGARALTRFEDGANSRIAITGTNKGGNGDIYIQTFDSNGSPVSAFADQGAKFAHVPVASVDSISGMMRDNQNRLLVWGGARIAYNPFPAVARYLLDGRLDTSFSADGVWVSEDLPGPVQSLAVQADGKILLALGAKTSTSGPQAMGARLTEAGELDANFANNGVVTHTSSASFDAVAISDTGRIYFGGNQMVTNDSRLRIVAYTAAGSIDTAFAASGVWSHDLSTSTSDLGRIYALYVHENHLWMAGAASRGYSDSMIGLLDTNGNWVTTFGNNGLVITDVKSSANSRDDALFRLIGRPEGGVYAVGTSAADNYQGAMSVLRTTMTGLDTSFSSDGIQTVDVDTSRQDKAYGVSLDGDKILISGRADNNSANPKTRAVAARLLASGDLDSSFASGGKLLFASETLNAAGGVVVDGERGYISGNVDDDAALVRINLGTISQEAPVISEGSSVTVNMDEDSSPTAFALTLHATDADTDVSSLTWALASAASHGSASVSASPTGSSQVIHYTPEVDYYGNDSFAIIVSDGYLSDSITVNVVIASQPDDPSGVPEIVLLMDGQEIASNQSITGPNLVRNAGSQTLSITVRNTGNATLVLEPATLSQITLVQANIGQQLPGALAANQEATLQINLSATSTGNYQFRCSFVNGDADENPVNLTISGKVLNEPPTPRTISCGVTRNAVPEAVVLTVDPANSTLTEDAGTLIWTISGNARPDNVTVQFQGAGKG